MRGVLKHTLVVRHPDTFVAVALTEGTEVPKWASKLVHQDDLVSDTENPSDGVDGDAGAAKPYAKWLKAELEAEVESRNENRDDDDLIVVGGTGKVADLAAALDSDDEATASAAGED